MSYALLIMHQMSFEDFEWQEEDNIFPFGKS